jgi:hypothetical protein
MFSHWRKFTKIKFNSWPCIVNVWRIKILDFEISTKNHCKIKSKPKRILSYKKVNSETSFLNLVFNCMEFRNSSRSTLKESEIKIAHSQWPWWKVWSKSRKKPTSSHKKIVNYVKPSNNMNDKRINKRNNANKKFNTMSPTTKNSNKSIKMMLMNLNKESR